MARIESDQNRFRQIVRGRVREELRRHLGHQDLIGTQGGRAVSIPIPHLELPHFAHDPGAQGVGQGDGDAGTGSQAGKDPGKHMLEAEFSVDELAQLLGEALELPRIEPRGLDELDAGARRYTGIAPVGPESLRHFKRSYRAALRRMVNLGLTDAVRVRQPGPGVYTFWDYQAGAWERNNGIRIDHVMLSPQIADRLEAVGIDKAVRGGEKPSDHVPVWVRIAA